jgi:hypothetical protein
MAGNETRVANQAKEPRSDLCSLLPPSELERFPDNQSVPRRAARLRQHFRTAFLELHAIVVPKTEPPGSSRAPIPFLDDDPALASLRAGREGLAEPALLRR